LALKPQAHGFKIDEDDFFESNEEDADFSLGECNPNVGIEMDGCIT